MYTAKAHMVGSPREPKSLPPPASVPHRSCVAAAAVDPEGALVMELTGHVVSEQLSDAKIDRPSTSTDGADARSDRSTDGAEHAGKSEKATEPPGDTARERGMRAQNDSKAVTRKVSDTGADAVGD